LGNFLRKDFEVDGTRVAVVLAGSDSVDMGKLGGMVQTIVKSEFDLMHGSPIDRYQFTYHAATRGAGGLEHLNATTISAPSGEFFKDDSWLNVATSHEFFHVWNAKRIHPKVFDVYDYSKPVHTKTVWFSEGITAYYADVALCRSGLMKKEGFYEDLAHIIDLYENNPAHGWLSWEDISWNVWDPKVQQGLSVWLLPAWMIDLRIRDLSNNRFSLDDVLRFMNVWFGEGGPGIEEDQIGMICSAVAQQDIRPFFDKYIGKPNSFPYDSLLSAAGLTWRVDSVGTTDLGCKLWWTTATKPSWTLAGHVEILGALKSGRAYQAGLRDGDEVLSINGRTFETEQVLREFERKIKTGESLEVKVSRPGNKKVFHLTVGSRKIIHSSIVEVERATSRQLGIRTGILKGLTNQGE
jgi:predicted metalloprotease with PDZ domain